MSSIDLELNDVKSSIDGIESNLARIQRDDGALANGSVTYDALSPSLRFPDDGSERRGRADPSQSNAGDPDDR